MIKVTVSYPRGDGVTFDMDYYTTSHMAIVDRTIRPVRREISSGIQGPNVAGVDLYFDSMEVFGAADMTEALADLGNFTNAAPVLQVSEVVES